MTVEALIAILLPLVLYVVLEKKKGLKVAIIASMISASALVAYFVLRYDFSDRVLWLEYALLMALGLVSIKMHDAKFFKFQPVVVNVVMGTYILVIHVVDQPVMLRFMPLFEKMIEEPMILEQLKSQRMIDVMTMMSWLTGVIFFIHAVLVAYAALKRSSVFWMCSRLAIYPMLAIVALVAGMTS